MAGVVFEDETSYILSRAPLPRRHDFPKATGEENSTPDISISISINPQAAGLTPGQACLEREGERERERKREKRKREGEGERVVERDREREREKRNRERER